MNSQSQQEQPASTTKTNNEGARVTQNVLLSR